MSDYVITLIIRNDFVVTRELPLGTSHGITNYVTTFPYLERGRKEILI